MQTYFLRDGLGSTMALTDDQGNVVGTYDYDVFGAVRSHTGAETEFSFTGEQNDPNGLEYLRARYYDAAVGRFVSRDPLSFAQLLSVSIDHFLYGDNDPVSSTDPTGLRPQGPAAKDERGKCFDGWMTCQTKLFERAKKIRKDLKRPEALKACNDFYQMCLDRVRAGGKGEFDLDGAFERILAMSKAGIVETIRRLLGPPTTGSAGLADPNQQSKEGGGFGVCWRIIY